MEKKTAGQRRLYFIKTETSWLKIANLDNFASFYKDLYVVYESAKIMLKVKQVLVQFVTSTLRSALNFAIRSCNGREQGKGFR